MGRKAKRLRSKMGPKGTLKMLVGGPGQIKLTEDGNVLLHTSRLNETLAEKMTKAVVDGVMCVA